MMWNGISVQRVRYSTVHYMMQYGIRAQTVQYNTVHDVVWNQSAGSAVHYMMWY